MSSRSSPTVEAELTTPKTTGALLVVLARMAGIFAFGFHPDHGYDRDTALQALATYSQRDDIV